MFLKDHLKDTYQKASFDKNHLMVENIINRWAHRFGIETLYELKVKSQNQVNFQLLGNTQYEKMLDPKPSEEKKINHAEVDNETYGAYKNK